MFCGLFVNCGIQKEGDLTANLQSLKFKWVNPSPGSTLAKITLKSNESSTPLHFPG